MLSTRNTLLLMGGLVAAALGGCKPPEEITSYRVPKPAAETTFATARLHGDIPVGWTKVASTGPFAAEAAFRVTQDGLAAETTASVLQGEGGGLLANVNRWRGQVKAEPLSEEQLRKEAQKIEVAGKPADYVDLAGPEAAGAQRERILGVLAARDKETWVFRMRGPYALVDKQKAAFESFVKSIRFGGS